jgi:nucleoside phosphorylase
MRNIDIVILTIIREEYEAICNHIENLIPDNQDLSKPNLYAWKTGSIYCPNFESNYNVAVGLVARKANTSSAIATINACDRYSPKVIIYIGIAGGFRKLKKGDIVIADTIVGYEYGTVNEFFRLQPNLIFQTDLGLLSSAIAFANDYNWKNNLKITPPKPCSPKVYSGIIASGEKVVEDPKNEFFQQVLSAIPKIDAVEMEGVGAAQAISYEKSNYKSVAFMMLRCISDLPRVRKPTASSNGNLGKKERDNWKLYASDSVASFTVAWIHNGLHIHPQELLNTSKKKE